MRIATVIERALIAVGVVCLGWACTTWLDAHLFQREQSRAFETVLTPADGHPSATPTPGAPGTAGPAATPTPNLPGPPPTRSISDAAGDVIGRLEIPRLGVSVVVMPGDDETTLSKAVGHLPDTPLPWASGNAALAGHRDTFFRPLEHVQPGDDIYLETPYGRLHYRVRQFMVVEPEDVWVLDPSARPMLTLITCYPFRYLGPAPQRFIVQADRV